jgi:iron complex outermembrane receptor protein
MNFMPSVVTTSDAGNGVGYTGIRVRGSDATRVNVTINGIPYNDSEGHGTFWVNMPDFASSVESLQLQRGVGTSTNGAGAFGASLNVLTDNFKTTASSEISNSFGSFNTLKNTVKFSTGLVNNHFEIAGRLSRIKSDGFVDRAASDLKSYFLQGTFIDKKTIIKALVFGGTEKTYQSWNGIDAETMARDRTYNSAGQFTDEFANIRFYDNETDNYQQDHFQVHWNQNFSDNWNSNLAFHYTKGKGYFENYIANAAMIDYGLTPFSGGGAPINVTDLIRQKWLDNDFYGTTFSVNYKKNKTDLLLGGGANQYFGRHFGKVIWARFASNGELADRYYDDNALKNDFNIFSKINYQLMSKLSFFGDLQLRNVYYRAIGNETENVNDNFVFFNPKVGFTYDFNNRNAVYFSFAKAQREPNRVDYAFGTPKPERLNDFELGWRQKSEKMIVNTNLYYMAYQDQLILTGNLDDVGNPIRSNSEKSYRFGLEVDAKFLISKTVSVQPNITFSSNKNIDLKLNNENVENKNIAFSPEIIAGNILIFTASKNLQIFILSKFVGQQFMNNIQTESAKLDSYFVNDLNFSYTITPKKYCKSIVFNGLINNFLNQKYVSNGYMYGDFASYYPQAGTNFLVGATVLF